MVVRSVDRSVLIDVSARNADNPPAASIAFVITARASSVDRTDGEITAVSILGREASWARAFTRASRLAIIVLRSVCMPQDCSVRRADANM